MFYAAEEKSLMNWDEGHGEIFPADIHKVNLSGPGSSSVSSPRGKLHLKRYSVPGVSEQTVLFEKTSVPTLFLALQETICVPTITLYRILLPYLPPPSHTVEEENRLLRVLLWPSHACHNMWEHMHICMCTQTLSPHTPFHPSLSFSLPLLLT